MSRLEYYIKRFLHFLINGIEKREGYRGGTL